MGDQHRACPQHGPERRDGPGEVGVAQQGRRLAQRPCLQAGGVQPELPRDGQHRDERGHAQHRPGAPADRAGPAPPRVDDRQDDRGEVGGATAVAPEPADRRQRHDVGGHRREHDGADQPADHGRGRGTGQGDPATQHGAHGTEQDHERRPHEQPRRLRQRVRVQGRRQDDDHRPGRGGRDDGELGSREAVGVGHAAGG
ncbi:MAG TPA: hypothetical protein VGA36_08385 [Nitriliruptorales bacterium]